MCSWGHLRGDYHVLEAVPRCAQPELDHFWVLNWGVVRAYLPLHLQGVANQACLEDNRRERNFETGEPQHQCSGPDVGRLRRTDLQLRSH